MSEELFPIESVSKDSPRIHWFKKFELRTQYFPGHDCEGGQPWSCWSGEISEAISDGNICNADTEYDAIVDWAIKNKVKLWNEE